MKNLVSKSVFLMLSSSLIFSCASQDLVSPELTTDSSNIASNIQKPVKNDASNPKVMSLAFATQIASALDINKDGNIDATEAPISIGDMKSGFISNHEQNGLDGKPTTPLAVKAVAERLAVFDASLGIYGTKISEKNRTKLLSNLSSVLVKDTIADGGKIFGYSSDVGYFTGKTTAKVCKMDTALISKMIEAQFHISSADKVNGQPAQMANGSVSIFGSYLTIDNTYKVRIGFSQYDIFKDTAPFFGSYTISDAASKIVK